MAVSSNRANFIWPISWNSETTPDPIDPGDGRNLYRIELNGPGLVDSLSITTPELTDTSTLRVEIYLDNVLTYSFSRNVKISDYYYLPENVYGFKDFRPRPSLFFAKSCRIDVWIESGDEISTFNVFWTKCK